MDPVEVAAWIIIASCVLPLLGWLLGLFVGWCDEASDIAHDTTGEYVKRLHEDRRNWEPYHPPTKQDAEKGDEAK